MEENTMKCPILATLAVTIAVAAGYADQSAKTVVVTVNRTPASSGKLMYASYCASCHGVYGKGNGPTAQALRNRPPDLTALSRDNGGRFPLGHVKAVLEFGAASAAHGTVQMPVWGPILRGIDTAYPGQNMGALRIINLSGYLESIQEK
jgi:mono/diheme cytochrome c family protein